MSQLVKVPTLNQFIMVGICVLGWSIIDNRLQISARINMALPF